MATNTRTYATLGDGATIDCPAGGKIRSGSADVLAPEQMLCAPTGIGYGPLFVGVPSGGLCTLDNVDFLPGADDGGILSIITGGSAAVAATRGDTADRPSVSENTATTTTRRGALALAAAVLGAGIVGSQAAAAAEELATLRVAEVDVSKLTSPMTIRVLDVIEAVLPPTTEILVDAEKTRVGEIGDPSEGVVLPANTTGTVRIYLRDSRGRLARLLSWAASIASFEDELTYRRTFPDEKKASDYDEGQYVSLTSHPAIVDPVTEDPDSTVMTIGNTRIPHNESETTATTGTYGIFDDTLIYEVGPDPPAASEYEIRMRVSRFDRLTS